jgi:hypothetical protein
MKINFSDYDGPTGLLVATGKEILALDSAAGATAFVGAEMQSGTIDRELAAEIQAAVDDARACQEPMDSASQRLTSSTRASVASRSSGSASSKSS